MRRPGTSRLPAPAILGGDPTPGMVPIGSQPKALAATLTTAHVQPERQFASIIQTGWVGHLLDTVDGRERALAMPRGGAGGYVEVTGAVLRQWAASAIPGWRQPADPAVWDRVAVLHLAWVRAARRPVVGRAGAASGRCAADRAAAA